jgi:hypothetical protein
MIPRVTSDLYTCESSTPANYDILESDVIHWIRKQKTRVATYISYTKKQLQYDRLPVIHTKSSEWPVSYHCEETKLIQRTHLCKLHLNTSYRLNQSKKN